jgi:hypothetical protein
VKKIIIIPLLIGVIAGLSIAFAKSDDSNKTESVSKVITPANISPQPTNIKASFLIYTNGTKRIFNDSRYHNQSKDVFIEPSTPNEIHVKTSGIKWNDFFSTLPMKLEKDCLTTGIGQIFCTNDKYELQFYINGVKNQNALDAEIKQGDKLLVTFDNPNAPAIKNQIDSVPNVK